jgi:hypothetical protein
LDLSAPAIASIKAARLWESQMRPWDLKPSNELLRDRSPNEAFAAAAAGRAYVVYFTDGGSVGLDLTAAPGTYQLRWMEIASASWNGRTTIDGGQLCELRAPAKGHWLATLVKW